MSRSRFLAAAPKWYVVALAGIFFLYLVLWANTAQIFATAYYSAGHLSYPDTLVQATGGDSGEYVALAGSLLHSHFALPGEAFEYFRTPGYPFFIALVEFFGGSYLMVTFLQILMTFGAARLIFALGTRVQGRTLGILASLLFLLNPLVILLSLQVMSDILFTSLLLLGVWLLFFFLDDPADSRQQIFTVICASFIFAAATYVRPAGILAFPLFIAPVVVSPVSRLRRVAYAAVLAGVVTLMLIPWMLRNYHDSGVFSFSSLPAYNITAYNVPLFEAALHHDSPTAERALVQTKLGIPISDWRILSYASPLEKYDRTVLFASPVQYATFHIFQSTGFFLNSGTQPLLAFMSGPFHYQLPPSSSLSLKDLLVHGQLRTFLSVLASSGWLFAERVLLLLGIVFAVIGVYALRRQSFAWLSAFFIVYLAMLAGPVAEARYRLPVEPFLALLIASGLLAMVSRILKRQPSIS